MVLSRYTIVEQKVIKGKGYTCMPLVFTCAMHVCSDIYSSGTSVKTQIGLGFYVLFAPRLLQGSMTFLEWEGSSVLCGCDTTTVPFFVQINCSISN